MRNVEGFDQNSGNFVTGSLDVASQRLDYAILARILKRSEFLGSAEVFEVIKASFDAVSIACRPVFN